MYVDVLIVLQGYVFSAIVLMSNVVPFRRLFPLHHTLNVTENMRIWEYFRLQTQQRLKSTIAERKANYFSVSKERITFLEKIYKYL